MIEALVLTMVLMAQPVTAGAANNAPPADTTPDPANAETPTESVTVEASRDVIHCRSGPPGTGSLLSRRVCTTARQEDARREHDQVELGRMQHRQTSISRRPEDER